MIKTLLLIVMLFNLLYAADKAAAISAVKANPSLLNTPQAQEAMQKFDVSKKQVLQKVQESSKKETKQENKEVEIKNDISDSKKAQEKTTDTLRISGVSANPLKYISEQKLIQKVQSTRQHVREVPLRRYASVFFKNKNALNTASMSVPDYYTINKKDMLTIYIYGGEDKVLSIVVDNYGNIRLPLLGPIKVAGLHVKDARELIKAKLKPTYPNSKILVQIKAKSSIQVNLTGYITAPGIYNLPSLSTVKDLLIAAHGVGKIGSIRNVHLKRDGKLLKIIDFYALIKDGNIVDTTLLKDGDVVFIPRAKKLVHLNGNVYVKAIYEMKKGEKLQDLIRFSGKLKPDASSKYIKIKRYIDNTYTKVFVKALKSDFILFNGDRVFVYKISQMNKKEIFVYGNIDKPGSYPMPKDGSLKTLLSQLEYLKNTAYNYALLQRFDESIISFAINNPQDIQLQMKDTIYIFNKYQIQVNDFVTIQGNMVRKPGKYRYLVGVTLQDIINNAGVQGLYNKRKVQILRWKQSGEPDLHFVDYEKNPNFALQPYDEITIFDENYFNPLQWIELGGEVNQPKRYIYTDGVTLKDALLMAGWFTQQANRNYIELTRYSIKENKREREFHILSDANLSFVLHPFDKITVKRIENWSEKKTITLKGEVKYPGVYEISAGDTLYDVLTRAGGFTKNAYLYASVFSRESVKKLQQKRLSDMLYKLKRKAAIIATSAKGAGEGTVDANSLLISIDGLIKDAKQYKPIGRIAIHLDSNLTKFKSSPYNITLKDKDQLVVPSATDSIIVTGEVLNESAFVYKEKDAQTYIEQAGGLTADASDVYFVVHANGFSEKGDFSSWTNANLKTLKPGDVIVIPLEIKTSTWYGVSNDLASIVYKLAITAASLKTVGAL